MSGINPLLDKLFFEQETLKVARALLGQHLYRWDSSTKGYIICRIVETEAYTQSDPACHAYKGEKGRGAIFYKAPGRSYVYLIYGMYHCLNVITEPVGQAGAVLIRAVEPLYHPAGSILKTHGPGRLCTALGINKAEHHDLDVTQINQGLFLTQGDVIPDEDVITTTRIGLSVAQDYPWRFYIKDNPWVSVKAKTSH